MVMLGILRVDIGMVAGMSAAEVHLDDLPLIETEVLVVGAGPTGLMAGVVCASRSVPAVVVDRKAGPTRESRALAVQARTMEIYDQLGLADQVLARANTAECGPAGVSAPTVPAQRCAAILTCASMESPMMRRSGSPTSAMRAACPMVPWPRDSARRRSR